MNENLYSVRPRPHDVAPLLESTRVILAIKNFATIPGVCHIGLGVTAANTMKVLRKNGVQCEAWSLDSKTGKGGEVKLLWERLHAEESKQLAGSHGTHIRPITHVIISAPSWILPINIYHLSLAFPNITFVQLNHSGCAYLSIDRNGIRNIKEVTEYQEMTHNIRSAGNNERFTKFVSKTFGIECLLIPNLYDIDTFVNPFEPQKICNTIRIGSFGASRPWKNQLCAAEAAIMIGQSLGHNIELYVNTKRPDGGEKMIESRDELFDGMPNAKIINVPWASWPRFRNITKNMHLLIQPSFDETFNVCTADGIAEGVPSVTSSALEWTPKSWWSTPEDPTDIMNVGITLLNNARHSVNEGRSALNKYASIGLKRWLDFLTNKPQMHY